MSIQPTSVYPVICTDKLQDTKCFYLTHFPFEIVFEAEWYVSRRSTGGHPFELAILDHRHETTPESFRRPFGGGLLINFEVEDVDSLYQAFRAVGIPIHLELRSEDFGERHLIASDPNGVLIDMIKVIPYSEAFTQGDQ